MLRPTCMQKSSSLSHRFGLYSTGVGGLDCSHCSCIGGEHRDDGGGWCRSLCRDSSQWPSLWCLLSSLPLLLLPSSSSSSSSALPSEGHLPPAARHAHHDGSGPHVSGRSGIGALLAPIAFIVCLIYPTSQGPKAINVNSVNILKQQAQVLNHENFPRHLWSSNLSFVVAACCDHVS